MISIWKKKILIHALGANMGGALRHLTNFLPEIGIIKSDIKYIILVDESFPKIILPDNIYIERLSRKITRIYIIRLLYDVIIIPFRLKKEKYSLVVTLTNFGPIWSPIPHIIFQRNSLYYCPYYLSKISGYQKHAVVLRKKLAAMSMKRADLIVTPSNAMADMIKTACPEVASKEFRTLYHGYSQDSYQEPLDECYSRLVVQNGCYKFLYPTHPGPHKGFEILFNILSLLKKKGLQFKLFVTIESKDWPKGINEYEKRIAALGLKNEVHFIGRIPQKQMGSLYKICDLMIYPSLCESFGFSMIEAMGYSLPIVAAGTAVNEEMCGDGAIYYSPLNANDGAKAVIEALQPGRLDKLIREGQSHVASYDWSWCRYVREFTEILKIVS